MKVNCQVPDCPLCQAMRNKSEEAVRPGETPLADEWQRDAAIIAQCRIAVAEWKRGELYELSKATMEEAIMLLVRMTGSSVGDSLPQRTGYCQLDEWGPNNLDGTVPLD